MLNVFVFIAVLLVVALVAYVVYFNLKSKSSGAVLLTTDGKQVAVGVNGPADTNEDEFGFDYTSSVEAYQKVKDEVNVSSDRCARVCVALCLCLCFFLFLTF